MTGTDGEDRVLGHGFSPVPQAANQNTPGVDGQPILETMTIAAIDRDPRNALRLDLPGDAGPALLTRVVEEAARLRDRFVELGDEAVTPGLADAFSGLADIARERLSRAEARLAELERQPAAVMTVEAIERDPWNAVLLTMPKAAEKDLYAAAMERVQQVENVLARMGDMHSHYDIEARDGGFALLRNFEIGDGMLAEYGLAGAEQELAWSATLAEMHELILKRNQGALDIRDHAADHTPERDTEPVQVHATDVTVLLAPAAEILTAEAIARDPWNAVKLPLPDELSLELATQVVETTADLFDRFTAAAERIHEAALPPTGVAVSVANHIASLEEDLLEAADMAQLRSQAVEEMISNLHARPEPERAPPTSGIRAATDNPPELDKASVEFAARVIERAYALRNQADFHADWAHTPEEAERWHELSAETEAIRDAALIKHELATARAAWQAPEFSLETIAADPWTAVCLPVPPAADRELLEYAREWAADLARYAEGHGALSRPLVNRDQLDTTASIAAAMERQAELDMRIEELQREPALNAAVRDDHAAGQASDRSGAVSLEAIEQDPWSVLRLDLPRDASTELVERVIDTAQYLQKHAAMVAEQAHTPDEAKSWRDLSDRAQTVLEAAFVRYDVAHARVEWQPFETRDADPRMAAAALESALAHQFSAPVDQVRSKLAESIMERMSDERSGVDIETFGGGVILVRLFGSSEEEILDWAPTRAELHDRIILRFAAVATPVTRDAIDHDPWNAVDMPLPDERSEDLSAHIAETVDQLIGTARGEHARAETPLDREYWADRLAAADARRYELAHGVDRAAAEERIYQNLREPRGEFLSPLFISVRLGEQLARVVDIVLETLASYFVAEPELTPQQIHDLNRANAERAETRAVQLAMREHDAAIAAANWHINHNLNHARTEDGARNGETFFDRYPGLTSDLDRDDGRDREAERAYYDTGIERGR